MATLKGGQCVEYGALGASPEIRPWLPVVGAFQSRILAAYAGERMVDYAAISPDVMRSDFDYTTVIANQNAGQSFAYAGHIIAPGVALVLFNGDALIANAMATH